MEEQPAPRELAGVFDHRLRGIDVDAHDLLEAPGVEGIELRDHLNSPFAQLRLITFRVGLVPPSLCRRGDDRMQHLSHRPSSYLSLIETNLML